MSGTLPPQVARFIAENAESYLARGVERITELPLRCHSSNRMYRIEVANGFERCRLMVKVVVDAGCLAESRVEYLNLERCQSIFSSPPYLVPRLFPSPVGQGVLITGECAGVTLKRTVLSGCTPLVGNDLAKRIASCGRWLARFHSLGDLQATELCSRSEVAEHSARFAASLGGLAATLAHGSPGLALLLASRGLDDEGVRKLMQVAPSFVHGDFGPGNILAHDLGITVLDFSYLAYVSRYFDVAQFLASLDTLNPYPRHPLFDRGRIPALKRAFMAGYREEGGVGAVPQTAVQGLYLLNMLRQYHRQRRVLSATLPEAAARLAARALEKMYLRRIESGMRDNASFLADAAAARNADKDGAGEEGAWRKN